MLRILEVIKKHDLTKEQSYLCLDAFLKKETAEKYKNIFSDLKQRQSSLQNDWFFEMMISFNQSIERSVNQIANRERNIENAFYLAIARVFMFVAKPDNISLFLKNNSLGGGSPGQILNNLLSAPWLPITFEEEFYPLSNNLNKVIKTYLDVYKIKKITPTIEAFRAYQNHCQLLKKLANYQWEEVEKIEDDFQYLLAFIYALKLYVFCYTEGYYLKIRTKNNEAFYPEHYSYDLGNNFLKIGKDIEYWKKRNLSVFHPNRETIEEVVASCADHFDIKVDEEIKPTTNKQTQVKEQMISTAYSETIQSKPEILLEKEIADK